mmetsp:Transcript_8545/g.20708  ORF Transcript_8545/g.20708 Transcript_8545/m.20708 type:complete len:242 (-) Transcript_8545:365-1090(-)|eukprot:CAMPEP_0178992998 /NCGR_PEP_ID=MMETSP0795-20121207/6439_1 /TAXON_ID=88552 /ORGANISM="Amoebophrya sp., Strain Ameob2" /LENGTH=241 /DNA_ID=CAMNT_0020684969 /DNA_START=78 /DNA_END=803 /DNA_ORIENTATION=-
MADATGVSPAPTVVAIVGASGGVGCKAVECALAQGFVVKVLVRSAEKLAKKIGQENVGKLEKVVLGSVDDEAALKELLEGTSVVLSCLGTPPKEKPIVAAGTAKILKQMGESNVKDLVMISSICVGDSLPQGKKVACCFANCIRPLILSKLFADLETAEDLCFSQKGKLSIVIVRPPQLTDQPGTGKYQWTDAKDFNPGAPAAIPRADVALAMVDLCKGGENSKFKELAGTAPSLFPAKKA